MCFFSKPQTSFMFNNAGVWHLIFITHHTHKHTSNGPVVFTSLVTTTSQKVSCYDTPIKMTRFQTRRGERKKNKTWFQAQRFNGFHFFSLSIITILSFLVLPIFSLEFFFSTRKTSGPRPCGDGPDEARKTLMFIRQSLNRFHRCQSGKVTVTAPIRANGQNGNKGTDWKSKLGNNSIVELSYREELHI